MKLENSFTGQGGMSGAPVSNAPYWSPEHFESEREKVFGRCWLMIGRVEEIPEPKDYMVRDVEICRAKVLLSRGRDNRISAFHNVCSHRTNQIMLDRQGSASAFVCSYHKWTYALDGSLRGVPDEGAFFGLDKSKCGLKRIHADVWNGFIFLNFEEQPSVSLTEYLGEFGKLVDGMHLPFATTPIVVEAVLECNWKAVMDGFSESYHVAAIHPQTIGDSFISKTNPFGRTHGMWFSGPHRRAVINGNPDYAPPAENRVEALSTAHLNDVALSTVGNVFGGESGQEVAKMLAHPSVNVSHANAWVNDMNLFFPNFHLDLSPGGFWTHQFWPLTPSRTRWESRWYTPRAASVRERFQQEHYIARVVEILIEDLGNTERQQGGLETGAQPYMQLCDTEAMIRHNLIHIDKWVNAESVADALAD